MPATPLLSPPTVAVGLINFKSLVPVLCDHDPVFHSLQAERVRGWSSEAVGRLWERRDKQIRKKGAEGLKAGNANYDKYYNFYRKTLPTKGRVFVRDEGRTFVDIGSAPGGLCKYLCADLGWRGCAYSLAEHAGGLEMRYVNAERLHFSHADLTEPDLHSRVVSEVRAVLGKERVDFINLGVVIGQHQITAAEDSESTCLDMLRVARNSFLSMLQLLKPGGSCLWIFSAAHVGPYFYFLNKLSSCFGGRLRVFATLVPSRSPAYCLCEGFEGAAGWEQELLVDMSPLALTPSSTARFCSSSWDEIQGLMQSQVGVDLRVMWERQRRGLEDVRAEAEAASHDMTEAALLKLSGHEGAALSDEQRVKTAEKDRDWRKRADDCVQVEESSGTVWRKRYAELNPGVKWDQQPSACHQQRGKDWELSWRVNVEDSRGPAKQAAVVDDKTSWRVTNKQPAPNKHSIADNGQTEGIAKDSGGGRKPTIGNWKSKSSKGQPAKGNEQPSGGNKHLANRNEQLTDGNVKVTTRKKQSANGKKQSVWQNKRWAKKNGQQPAEDSGRWAEDNNQWDVGNRSHESFHETDQTYWTRRPSVRENRYRRSHGGRQRWSGWADYDDNWRQ